MTLQCPRVIDTDLLLGELQIVKKCLAQSGSPVVFSNNDLHASLIIIKLCELRISDEMCSFGVILY